jgi:hypothetical protein
MVTVTVTSLEIVKAGNQSRQTIGVVEVALNVSVTDVALALFGVPEMVLPEPLKPPPPPETSVYVGAAAPEFAVTLAVPS